MSVVGYNSETNVGALRFGGEARKGEDATRQYGLGVKG
jgi:hypothetical protein